MTEKLWPTFLLREDSIYPWSFNLWVGLSLIIIAVWEATKLLQKSETNWSDEEPL